MEVGKIQTLKVLRINQIGAFLGEVSDGDSILLPRKYLPQNIEDLEEIEVFVYRDSEDRIISTTLTPFGVLGEIKSLRVVSTQNNGVFLDLGIAKDIFMPSHNPHKYKVNQNLVVLITKDKEDRLLAVQVLKSHLKPMKNKDKKYMEVDILPFRFTPLGIECVVDGLYFGLLFKNEVFSKIELGAQIRGYIKNVRDDGKIDLMLNLPNSDHSQNLLKQLKANKQTKMPTQPQAIYDSFGMSKKTFKRTINSLIKSGKIKLQEDMILAL